MPEADYAPTLAARTDGFTKAESWGAEDATIAEHPGLVRSAGAMRATHIETDHEVFDLTLHRALLDLQLLIEEFDGDLVPTAGIPWFAVPFGRDSLITAMQTLPVRPDIAAGTLRFLADHQGTRVNKLRDEEPGKILHEVRPGERGGVVPQTHLLRQHRCDAAVCRRPGRVRAPGQATSSWRASCCQTPRRHSPGWTSSATSTATASSR